MLENSIDERYCQQHVGSERELLHAFPRAVPVTDLYTSYDMQKKGQSSNVQR